MLQFHICYALIALNFMLHNFITVALLHFLFLYNLRVVIEYFCTTGPPGCSLAMDATAKSGSCITVKLTWTNCAGTEPSNILLTLSSTATQDSEVINGRTRDFDGLEANTTYQFSASFMDACGSISAVVVATTLPTTGECGIMC